MNHFTQLFYKRQLNSGLLLIIIAFAAMIIANSSLSGWYNNFFSTTLALRFGDFNLFSYHGKPMTLLEFINDSLMTIFFFMVGLEIKREVLAGELSSFRQAILPIIAACGGMIAPIIVFRIISPNPPDSMGCAIPMATDIAFAVGVLGLLGDRVPTSLKVFLTALAVVDDIGGIIVIAIFYSSGIVWEPLLYSLILFALLFLVNRLHIPGKFIYLFIGLLIWIQFLKSGIHCTISGVLIAFFIPARPRMNVGKYVKIIKENLNVLPDLQPVVKGGTVVLTNSQIEVLKQVESASDRVISPLQDMEDGLHPLVNYVIMPLFAFANAGVILEGLSLETFTQGVTLSAMFGLIIGKFLGIFSFTWAMIRMHFIRMPDGMNWKNLAGVSMLGGIGFTVSLFIANLSYANLPEIGMTLLNDVKIGVLSGSIISGLLGFSFLHWILPKESNPKSIKDRIKEMGEEIIE